MLLYLRSHCFDDLQQAGSHMSQYGTGVDSRAAHSEYQSSLLVVRAARVPLRAPKSMDFSTGSTSEASSLNLPVSSLMLSVTGMSRTSEGFIRAVNHFSSTVNTILRQKRRSEGYLFMLLVHGFLVLQESRRSLSVKLV